MRRRLASRAWVAGLALTLGATLSGSPAGAENPQLASQTKAGFGLSASDLVAGQDFVAGEVIVGPRRLANGRAASFAMPAMAQVAAAIDQGPVLLRFPSEAAAVQELPALLADPSVSFVERNGIVSIPPMSSAPTKNGKSPQFNDPGQWSSGKAGVASVSTDPGVGFQWHHTVIRTTAALGTLSPTPPTVAVIDTGVDYTHSDLAGKVILGQNCVTGTSDPFDDHGHGTHVAGLVAAAAGNGRYGEGVSPLSNILAVKVLGSTGSGTFFQVACGLQAARTAVTTPPTMVGNLSIGGPTSQAIAAEISAWRAAGKVLVVAAGNQNTSAGGHIGVDPNIGLRVMATEEHDCRTFFSNFSPTIDPNQFNIAAPGWQIPSTLPAEGFGSASGTSMASPIVAGAAALVWGQFPALTRDEVIARLVNNGHSVTCGFAAPTRRLDVRRALLQTPETVVIGRVLDAASGMAPIPSATGTTVQVRTGTTVLQTATANRGGTYEIAAQAGLDRNLFAIPTGYIADQVRFPITVLQGVPTGPFTDAVSAIRPAGFFHGTIAWGNTQPNNSGLGGAPAPGWDLDMGVRLPAGTMLSVGPAGDLSASPFVLLPRDSFNDFKPVESFVISPQAAPGTYRIVVGRKGSPAAASLDASGARVRFYDGATPGLSLQAPACPSTQPFWHVADVVKNADGTYAVASVNACVLTFP